MIIYLTWPKPVWRNWQTHMTQNHAPLKHVGSSPTTGTIIISRLKSFCLSKAKAFVYQLTPMWIANTGVGKLFLTKPSIDPGTGIPPGKIIRQACRDGTLANDFAGFGR